MPDYRRMQQPGGTYFFTIVTYERRNLFDTDAARQLLHTDIATVRNEFCRVRIADPRRTQRHSLLHIRHRKCHKRW